MIQDKYLNQTLTNWIERYKSKEKTYRAYWYTILTADYLLVMAYPVIFASGLHFGRIKTFSIVLLFFLVFLFTTIRVWKSYRSCKVLIQDLEYERELYVSGSAPYELDDDPSFKLFVKRNEIIITNSIPELSYMPEDFALSVM